MSGEGERVYVKVLLRGDVLKNFRYIKSRLGLESDAEVIRYLIMQEYLRLTGEP
ncbi:MAG: hypothetical protein QXQ29_03925 [Candidatus Bathyarchaeia archaeon]